MTTDVYLRILDAAGNELDWAGPQSLARVMADDLAAGALWLWEPLGAVAVALVPVEEVCGGA